jgi:hypothetical protein
MHSPAPAACLNCEAALTGPYCAQCGQDAHTQRFSWGYLLHEIPHSVWHVDKGLPYTIWEMLVRPGATMRRYLAGQRVRLFRPLALVLLVAGIASFLILALHVQVLQILFFLPLRYTQGTPQFFPVYVFENLAMPLYQVWAFTSLARGGYRLGGSLWRGVVITALGFVLNTLVIGALAGLLLWLKPH